MLRTTARKIALAGALVLVHAACLAYAQTVQDLTALEALVRDFTVKQTAQMRGETAVAVGKLDTRLQLAPCPSPAAFLPPGQRLWGRSLVGVQCFSPVSWKVLVPVEVRVSLPVLVTTRTLSPGQPLRGDDFQLETRDVTQAGASVLTESSAALEMTVTRIVQAREILRADMLRAPQAVAAGETVRVQYAGPGFVIRSEGRAVGSALAGQIVQVRMASGQLLSGTARAGGVVELRL